MILRSQSLKVIVVSQDPLDLKGLLDAEEIKVTQETEGTKVDLVMMASRAPKDILECKVIQENRVTLVNLVLKDLMG